MSRSGFANRASTCEAWASRVVRRRFLVGRFERGSAEVGIDSGIGSDIVVVREWCCDRGCGCLLGRGGGAQVVWRVL